jgi:hypothetical protein
MRIIVIGGSLNESWSETEREVRNFIANDLSVADMEHVYGNKRIIFVKFSRFKYKDSILVQINKARQVLDGKFTGRVKEDFEDCVKLHRTPSNG